MHTPARAGIQHERAAVSSHTVTAQEVGGLTPLAVVTVTYSPGKHLPALVDTLSAATGAPTRLVRGQWLDRWRASGDCGAA